jgi:hypothetical protein
MFWLYYTSTNKQVKLDHTSSFIFRLRHLFSVNKIVSSILELYLTLILANTSTLCPSKLRHYSKLHCNQHWFSCNLELQNQSCCFRGSSDSPHLLYGHVVYCCFRCILEKTMNRSTVCSRNTCSNLCSQIVATCTTSSKCTNILQKANVEIVKA